MIKNKKILLNLGVLGTIGSSVLAVISCAPGKLDSKNPSSSWALKSRRNIKVVHASESGKQSYVGKDFYFIPDMQAASTTFSESVNSYYVSGLRQEIVNFPVYSKSGKLISGEISKTFLKFDLYDKIHLILTSNEANAQTTKITFDSDSNDPLDTKSINGDNFKNKLKSGKVSKILFHMRSDVYWVHNKTGQKVEGDEGRVTVEDFLASVKFDKNGNSRTRYDATETVVSIQALDDFSNAKNKTSFSPPTGSSAPSPFEGGYKATYGLITENIENMISKETNEVIFSFSPKTPGNKVTSLWNERFERNGGLISIHPRKLLKSGEPSDELVKEVQEKINQAADTALSLDELKLKNQDEALVKAYIKKLAVWKSGFYKYHSYKWRDYMSAGQYFLKSLTDKNVVFARNEHYGDKRWLQDDKTILSYTHEFISLEGDYHTSIFTGYNQGIYVESPIDDLPESSINKINLNAKKYGVFHTLARTTRKQIGERWTRFNFLPIAHDQKEKKHFYFNDGYAKLMFGANLKQLAGIESAKGTPLADGTWVERNVSGIAAQFRTSMYAAINWYAAAIDKTKTSQEWTSRIAPEQTLIGNELAIESKRIYSTYGLGIEGNKLKATRFSHEEKVEIANDIVEGNDRYLANGEDLVAIKKNIKHALDTAGITKNEKVMFELSIDFLVAWSEDTLAPLEKIRKAIETLDPDGRIVVAAAMDPIDANDNYTDGSKALTRDYQKSYDIKGWTLKGASPADKKDIAKKYVFPRLGSGGIAAFPLNSAITFTADTLTQLISYFGYLQDGVWAALAYYSNPINSAKLPIEFKQFGVFAKTVMDGLQKKINGITKLEISNISGYEESDEDVLEAKSAVDALQVVDIVKSNAIYLSKHDYFGIAGNGAWKEWTNKVNSKNATPKQKKIKKAISLIFNAKFKENEFDIREDVQKYDRDKRIEFINGFDTIIGNSFTYWNVLLGSRTSLTPSLKKKWYKTNGDAHKMTRIGSYRIET